jgi:hypothetical protein
VVEVAEDEIAKCKHVDTKFAMSSCLFEILEQFLTLQAPKDEGMSRTEFTTSRSSDERAYQSCQ